MCRNAVHLGACQDIDASSRIIFLHTKVVYFEAFYSTLTEHITYVGTYMKHAHEYHVNISIQSKCHIYTFPFMHFRLKMSHNRGILHIINLFFIFIFVLTPYC